MENILSQNILTLRRSSIFARKSSIGLRTIVKKKKISSEKLFQDEKRTTLIFQQRRRRQKKEELLEANSIKSLSSPTVASLAGKAKGFLGRIMGAIGSLFLGWIINNYPIIRTKVLEFKQKIETIVADVKQFFANAYEKVRVIRDFAETSFQTVRQNFNFENIKESLKNITSDLENKFTQLKDSFFDVYDDIVKDLPKTIFEYLGIPMPKEPEYYGPGGNPDGSGEGQAQQRPQQPQQSPQTSAKNPDLWTLVAISALEDSDPQGRADVAQSIYNRKKAGAKFGYQGGSIKGLILHRDGGEYEPVGRAVKEFRLIEDRESAIRAVMKADNLSREVATREVDATLRALSDKTLQKNAAEWVQGRTDFYGASLKPPQSASDIRQRNANDNKFGNFVGPGSKSYARQNPSPAPVPSFGPAGYSGAPITGDTGSAEGVRPPKTSVSISNSPFAKEDTGGARIISGMGKRFGRNHKGIDIAAEEGTGLYAYLPGKITQNKFDPGYGNLVEWRDSVYNQLHLFSHMFSRSPLKVGEEFDAGDLLGRVGSTGRSDGPHLHWEIGPAGSQIDPIDWINSKVGEKGYMGPTMKSRSEGDNVSIIMPQQSQPNIGGSGDSSPILIGSGEDTLNRIMNINLAYV